MHATKDFFISYGRRESLGFVARLHRALILKGYTGWLDKVNIPDGEAYDQRISNGIESADNFVFVMAPRCLTSPYCLIELEYARVLGKRVIPINQMVIFQTEEQELSAGDQAVLKGFYKANNIPEQNITTTQQVLDRSLALIGTTDWLDGKQNLSDEACDKLREWAGTYENSWHKHEDAEYLKQNDLPTFGEVTDSTESIVERIVLVAEKQKAYVKQHNLLTLDALQWTNNQKLNNYLLVGKERQAAEEWLLTDFTPPNQPPCTPSDLLCEFIGEARKNAENRMTDVFICSSSKNKETREQLIQALLRHAITSWSYDTDIQKSVPYEEAITQGIEGADNFFFLISPDSVASPNCAKELAYAQKHNKRILPLLIAPTPEEKIPEVLRGLQYVDFTDNIDHSDFNSDIDDILNVLKHEKSYYEEHKILLTRALQWENSGRKSSFLLRGFNLENANTWLQIHRNRGAHGPTALHSNYIETSEATKGQLNTDVFISYSRKDGDFARQLNRKLQENGKNTWFDQESISTGVDFEREIFKGIKGANNIVFLLSPDSVQSEYCEREVEYAASLGKRFITLLVRETEPSDIPEVLRKINWIDFSGNDFEKPFLELAKEIDLDRAHVQQHTILQQRALEWEENGRSDDFLLNESASKNAEHWLDEGGTEVPEIPFEDVAQEVKEEKRDLQDIITDFIFSIISAMSTPYTVAVFGLALWSIFWGLEATNPAFEFLLDIGKALSRLFKPILRIDSVLFALTMLFVAYILPLLVIRVRQEKKRTEEKLKNYEAEEKLSFLKKSLYLLKNLVLHALMLFIIVYLQETLTHFFSYKIAASLFASYYLFVLLAVWLQIRWAKKRLKKLWEASDASTKEKNLLPLIQQYTQRNEAKQPHPTQMQVDYIHASRMNIAIENSSDIQRNETLNKRLKRSNVAFVAALFLFLSYPPLLYWVKQEIDITEANFLRAAVTLAEREQETLKLDLSNLNLPSIPEGVIEKSKLEKLDLSGNELTELPTEIGDLENLTELNLESNQLTSLPKEIKKLTKLRKLNLNYNDFSEEEKKKIRGWLPNCKNIRF